MTEKETPNGAPPASKTSLSALQNLQPWMSDAAGADGVAFQAHGGAAPIC